MNCIVKNLRIAGAALALAWVSALPASACSVCFGAPGSDVNKAMGMAILFMLGILVFVLGAFIGFFIYLKKRAEMPQPDYLELTELKTEN